MMLQDALNANPISFPNIPKNKIINNNVIITLTSFTTTSSAVTSLFYPSVSPLSVGLQTFIFSVDVIIIDVPVLSLHNYFSEIGTAISHFQQIKKESIMSTYAISDLHGQYDIFEKLLDVIDFSENDFLYVLGDAIDRGPDGIKILQKINQLFTVAIS